MAHWIDRTHSNFFTKDSLCALLTSTGFRVTEVSDCYKVSPNSYFWNTLRIRPRSFTHVMKYLCERLNLCETYWSSILVVAEISEPRNR
jgi:hypothetical protein